MDNYNFGKVNIEFNTNKIFLLMQMLYRMDSLESNIHANEKVSYLSEYVEEFKKVVEDNKQGLEEFNLYKDNAENKNMWAEYGEYIESFSQISMEELKMQNPIKAKAIDELMNTRLFAEVDRINDEYSNEMEDRFIKQTKEHKEKADTIVEKTETKKIIYMPFTPELFSIEPCCLSDKDENGEYAVEFTIPTEKEKFEEMFGMEYTEGIESVILFHEKLHADLPTQSNERFINYMQREVDSHLKHSIIELLANGEMGVKMADHSSYFQSVFHMGKIPYGNRVLTTNDLQELGMKDNELLHTEAREKFGEYSESFSKNEMGIIKIRGMMYPYVLMYNNRNNDNQLENVVQAIQRDSSLIEEIYGREFLEKIQDKGFLQSVQQSVKPYDSILEFAEGMSKELLGIEQVKDIKKIEKGKSDNIQQAIFGEDEIGKATDKYEALKKNNAISVIQKDRKELNLDGQIIGE